MRSSFSLYNIYLYLRQSQMDGRDVSTVGGFLNCHQFELSALFSPQQWLVHRKTLLKYHYFTDTHNVPLAGEDSETPVEWSQIKGSGVKFFTWGKAIGLFFEKAVSRMKSPDRPPTLMKFIAVCSDLALNWEKAFKLQKVRSTVGGFSDYVKCVCVHALSRSVCCLIGCNQSVW